MTSHNSVPSDRFSPDELSRFEGRLRDLLEDIDQVRRQLRSASTGVGLHTKRAALSLALQRLSDGSFGRCVSCGGDVEPLRLLDRPETDRCESCQSGVAG